MLNTNKKKRIRQEKVSQDAMQLAFHEVCIFTSVPSELICTFVQGLVSESTPVSNGSGMNSRYSSGFVTHVQTFDNTVAS